MTITTTIAMTKIIVWTKITIYAAITTIFITRFIAKLIVTIEFTNKNYQINLEKYMDIRNLQLLPYIDFL